MPPRFRSASTIPNWRCSTPARCPAFSAKSNPSIRIDPIAGHIPNATCVPFTENLSDDGRFLPVEQLRRRLNRCWATSHPAHRRLLWLRRDRLPQPVCPVSGWLSAGDALSRLLERVDHRHPAASRLSSDHHAAPAAWLTSQIRLCGFAEVTFVFTTVSRHLYENCNSLSCYLSEKVARFRPAFIPE